jgi:hypothetical protein
MLAATCQAVRHDAESPAARRRGSFPMTKIHGEWLILVAPGLLGRLIGVSAVAGTFTPAGVLAPQRPHPRIRIGAAARREGMDTTTGIAIRAQRCPNRTALGEEIGVLTAKERDHRCNALAAAQQVRANLAHYKVPRDITVLDDLPRNNTGKALRRELSLLAVKTAE